ncbi:MAG: inositol-3-phosphate synthase, partial [Desulfohalobiaceae bacterium]|nr:inositol-3-phosphate synthase [Desulfohalobiaceae bacterium]
MSRIKVAIVGLGNCASALLQGIYAYRDKESHEAIGLMHWEIGGYRPGDIELVAVLDIDRRKVGRDVSEAVFARPNCTTVFYPDIPSQGVTVHMGRVLDGISEHMQEYKEENTFVPAGEAEPSEEDVVRLLRESGAQILVNYLPVGSEEATRFYAECALR